MWRGSYGKEPFDLRLTGLRLLRNLDKIVIGTLAGTLLFGGGYYVKNVILRGEDTYEAVSTYKVEYAEEPSKSGDYYINEMSWNTYVDSRDFLDMVQAHLQEMAAEDEEGETFSNEELADMIEAKLASDLHIPSTIVTADSPEKSVQIAAAVEASMTQEFAETNREISSIYVINPADEAAEVVPDVRPARAFILSAVLSCFFAVIILALMEMGADSIWLPVTLRRRYGLSTVGTVESEEVSVNLAHRFAGKKRIAVCTVDAQADPAAVIQSLHNLITDGIETDDINTADTDKTGKNAASWVSEQEWIPIPAPLLCAESCEILRKMDGILLVVRAGSHTGKPLEYLLEYFAEQEIDVTAALLWEADEMLIRAYYFLPGGVP